MVFNCSKPCHCHFVLFEKQAVFEVKNKTKLAEKNSKPITKHEQI